jgi:hypothetical protein
MVLRPFIGHWPLFQFLDPIQSVGLLWRGISSSQGRYLHTEQHKQRIKAHRHPCLEWDWKPRSQRSSERRQFMPQTARPLWSAMKLLTILKWSRVEKLHDLLFKLNTSLDKNKGQKLLKCLLLWVGGFQLRQQTMRGYIIKKLGTNIRNRTLICIIQTNGVNMQNEWGKGSSVLLSTREKEFRKMYKNTDWTKDILIGR